MDKMSITLPSGLKLEGTMDQIIEAARLMGADVSAFTDDGIHWLSQSKGLISISEMQTGHLRNALAKLLRDALDKAKSEPSARGFTMTITKVLRSNTFLAMLDMLSKRTD